MSEQHAMDPQAAEGNSPTQPQTTGQTTTAAQNGCSCPTTTSSEPGGGTSDTAKAALISADIDANTSGVNANVDALGHDLADVAIGLGALNPVLGLLDGSTCGDSGGSSMSSAAGAPLLAAAVSADMSGVQANVDVLGHDTVDASIGLGALDPVLGLADPQLGLVDTASDLADGLLCNIV